MLRDAPLPILANSHGIAQPAAHVECHIGLETPAAPVPWLAVAADLAYCWVKRMWVRTLSISFVIDGGRSACLAMEKLDECRCVTVVYVVVVVVVVVRSETEN
jgi:hypothetical protein